MKVQRYQWVGLLAGVPLFSGAWLTAFYNNLWWGVAGLVLTLWGLYVANQVERRATNTVQARRGLVAGLLAGVLARLLGYGAMLIAGVNTFVSWGSIGDVFRVVISGDWLATVLLLVLVGALGLAMAVIEPDRPKAMKSTKGRR